MPHHTTPKGSTNALASPSHVFRVDRFLVPLGARDEFVARVRQTHEVLRAQPGLVRDHLLERSAGPDAIRLVTIAEWDGEESITRARAAVQALHQRAGFEPRELMERLGITPEMGTYRPVAFSAAADGARNGNEALQERRA